MEKIIKLNLDEVITCERFGIVSQTTFKVQEAMELVSEKVHVRWDDWIQNGKQCEIIGPNTEGWIKGRVRICLEFIPDEPEPKPVKEPESPLDDLRQQVAQLKD